MFEGAPFLRRLEIEFVMIRRELRAFLIVTVSIRVLFAFSGGWAERLG